MNLCGGVGNQLFQIAVGYATSKTQNTEFGIDYKLQHNLVAGYPSTKYKDNLFKNVSSVNITGSPHQFYQEPKFSYTPIPQFNGNILINGYFQCEKYFHNYANDIKKLFAFPEQIISTVNNKLHKLNGKRLVCIHVRRGDYLKYSTVHPVQPVEYYTKGMAQFNNCIFIVISDDIEWCQNNLARSNVIFSNPNMGNDNELFDLYLATQCHDFIICNSSFSWWGAWLSECNDKRVYAPVVWFGPDGPQDYHDVYCDGWEKL